MNWNRQALIVKGEHIKIEVVTTDQILLWPDEDRAKLRTELEYLFHRAFSKMPENAYKEEVNYSFKSPGKKFQRQNILYRNEESKLIAAVIFDYGDIEYDSKVIKGIYILNRVVLPEYQSFSLGKRIAVQVLTEWQPGILLTTCAQSSSLHSWVKLSQNGLIKDFEVYPRLEREEDKEVLVTVPYKDRDFVVNAFKQIFLGVVDGEQETVDKAISNLTVQMIRKNMYAEMYNFSPWEKDGREDPLAKALGVNDRDGILVIFRKKHKRQIKE